MELEARAHAEGRRITIPLEAIGAVNSSFRGLHRMRTAQALEATDPAKRKLYETGAVAYEKWAERLQSALETARHVEPTAATIS